MFSKYEAAPQKIRGAASYGWINDFGKAEPYRTEGGKAAGLLR